VRTRIGYSLIGAAVWWRRLYTVVALLMALTVLISLVSLLFDDQGWLPPFGTNGSYAWTVALLTLALLLVGRVVMWALARVGVLVLPANLQGLPSRRARRRSPAAETPPGDLSLELVTIRESMDPRSGTQAGHRRLMIFCLGVLVLILLAQGITSHTLGATREPGADVSGIAPVGHQRPLLAVDGHLLRSHQPPPGKRLALTFDDGPDPIWTPRVMSVLRRYHVPATFFVVGSRVARYPGLVRQEHRDGFELGNHTFTHADLGTLPFWEASSQVALTESTIMGVTGIRTRLFRPPYSATPDAITPHQEQVLGRLAGQGYIIAVADIDPEDWSRPGVATIVRRTIPNGSTGGVVLMHDAGGNRSQTVAALEQLIPRLQRAGWRFCTLAQMLGVPESTVQTPARPGLRLSGRVLVTALAIARWITDAAIFITLTIGVLVIARLLLVFLLARRHARNPLVAPGDLSHLPGVSIIVPAYNEAVGIERGVRSLADSDYPEFEIVVVDDGSDDGTGDIVERAQIPGVRLIRQANQGKPKALNNGIEHARHDIVVTVDGDTVFERQTLRRLVQPFRFENVGAVSGNTKIGNRQGLLGRWQHIEYVMGFNLDRRMYEVLDCMPTVPGAIGAFRKQALADVGRVSSATLAEDTDVTMAIGRAGWRTVYVQDARAWTEAPSTLGQLWRQRYRWAYGTIQSVYKHRGAVLVKGDRIGRRAVPYLFLFQVVMPLCAPLIDLFALYGIFFLDPLPIALAWIAFNLVQLGLGLYAFRLDGEDPRPLLVMPLQQLVYRQMMYLVVIESVINALAGSRLLWQRMERTGTMQEGLEGSAP
jgi:cellulose synthase/poly-beta-1,6-N-acetylglucosamine synthase-like glycosyltransferase/peptidoglycan/xylan/chitin deacetylase (PgdA/CDA1 family)